MMSRALLIWIALVASIFGQEEEKKIDKAKVNHQLFGKSQEESFEGKVVVVTVGEYDLMNKKSFAYWRKIIRRADEEKAKALIFDLDTPGGLAFDTAEIISEEMSDMKTPSFSFVNPNAISAGALISIGTDGIYLSPKGRIGSAAVVNGSGQEMDPAMRAKIEALLGAYVRQTVKKKGHRLDVIEAMMFADEENEKVFGEVKVRKGKLLTLTADEAVEIVDGKPLLGKGIVKNIQELSEKEGFAGAEIVRAEPSGFEKIAWWVGIISPILILIGLGGGYLEMKTPGFGIGGVISIAAFSLFFFGNYIAGNLAGYEVAAVFVLGIILLLVEFFIFPGLVIPGLMGVLLIIGAIFFAMVDEFAIEDFRRVEFSGESFARFFGGALWRLAAGFLGSLILLGLMIQFLPSIPFFNRAILTSGEESTSGKPSSQGKGQGTLVGKSGVAVTDLRPAGKVEIEGKTLDVTIEEGFLEKGHAIKILREEQMRIVVQKA